MSTNALNLSLKEPHFDSVLHIFFNKNTFNKNDLVQICHIFRNESRIKNFFFSNAPEKEFSVLWFLNVMSAVGLNIKHTISHFLLKVMRVRCS